MKKRNVSAIQRFLAIVFVALLFGWYYLHMQSTLAGEFGEASPSQKNILLSCRVCATKISHWEQ